MQETVDSGLAKVAEMSVLDEYTDYKTYLALSRRERNPVFKKALEELAEQEQHHYEFWKKYAPNTSVRINRLKLYFVLLLRFTLGLTFTMKFLERHEDAIIARYNQVAPSIPAQDRTSFDEMVNDEQHHESYLMGEVKEGRVKYMSFIVLGLADAVVEISGIHAGSLGVYEQTRLAGLAGIIAGMAASIAMASAAYAQAKQGFEGSAKWSAIYTGISYMFTAIFLALPYFLTESMIYALSTSVLTGVVLVAMMTYYDTVISRRPFKRQFGEIAGIILGASLALYIAGFIIHQYFGGKISI
ncbi:MAG TPA: VIT1/CCC1 family protein [Candidatus Binatus sp.]|nr:VIT1/CCC1 family protein [Candidatus Binatus sp.]